MLAAIMVLYRTIALGSFVVILLMAERSSSYIPGGIRKPMESCNKMCWINDDDSRTSCPTHCLCQAKTGADGFPLYGQGLCVKVN
uniref:8 kDa Amblyomma family member n=1 Tax=Rhipicephalus appendiculatus TaxID=34631 RepID=A0A131YHK2_RHIAP